jgi:hypothetical protein
MSSTTVVAYSDSFGKKVKAQFDGNVKILEALWDGSPFLGELMANEVSAINDLYLDWAKVEMHKHFAEKQS